MERYEWAAQHLTSHDFGHLLEDVQREDLWQRGERTYQP
jgi:hypothetical protein